MDETCSQDVSRWELARGEGAYPAALEDMEHPPKVIYGRGDPEALSTMCLSIIGARRATPYGIAVASMAARIAAESGITVVSGGAMGCDAAAARGALDAGGKTVVVSGVGADGVYPSSSRDVFDRAVRQGGAVISMVPWGSPVQRWAFPQRNGLIAALSAAVVVSEASARSGTASTATAAFGLGREVYAVPGSIFSPESQGANALIRDGAHIITCEADLEMLISRDYGVLRMIQEDLPTPRGRVLSALVASPMRADDLAAHLGEEPLTMLRILAEYEVHGVVQRLPDGRYAPTRETLLGHGRMGS
ncbi:MAG: DNA-processing protein DprA [Acidobacteriota bacterium]|nr:DNA-processing protein DprA [Acidobacteriota bacterium]